MPEGVKVVFTDSGKGHIGGLDDIHLADGLYCVAHSLECFHTNCLSDFAALVVPL